MRKNANLKELDEPIRSFLTDLEAGDAILVSDEDGIQYSVVRFTQATQAERDQAWQDIGQTQRKVGKMMEETGKTEEELDELLREDD